jgi:transposase
MCVVAEAKGKSRKEKKRFGTFTHDLLQLADWLAHCGVTHVATESTGVYWKPVWNILAEQFEVLLVNAQHIKAVPVGPEDGPDRQRVDRGLAAARIAPREFRAPAANT